MVRNLNNFKVVLLGEGRVGKTSLLVRFVENKFSEREQATVKARPFAPRPLALGTEQVELSLWDTAGQERFHSLGPIYYRDASAALLVFDITDLDSFERVKEWVKELQQMSRSPFKIMAALLATEKRPRTFSCKQVAPDIVLCIAANKCDLEKQRSVPEATIREYATCIGASWFNTSAKTGAGLQDAFIDLAKRCLEQQHAQMAREASIDRTGSAVAQQRHRGLLIADEPASVAPTKSSACC